MVIQLSHHQNQHVTSEAFLLLQILCECSDPAVQDLIMAELQEPSGEKFFAACRDAVRVYGRPSPRPSPPPGPAGARCARRRAGWRVLTGSRSAIVDVRERKRKRKHKEQRKADLKYRPRGRDDKDERPCACCAARRGACRRG